MTGTSLPEPFGIGIVNEWPNRNVDAGNRRPDAGLQSLPSVHQTWELGKLGASMHVVKSRA
jgi:hypothetical protein